MKVVLDEDVPSDFHRHLPGLQAFSVTYLKWNGVRNGNLMRRCVAEGFEALVTRDVKLKDQRPREAGKLVVALLRIGKGTIDELVPHAGRIAKTIASAEPGSFVVITATSP